VGITSAIAFLLKLLDGIMGYFRDKKIADGAVAEAKVHGIEGQLHDVQVAQSIRDRVRSDVASNPDILRAPDPNSRD